jgi:alanyl-tRNA synthetase
LDESQNQQESLSALIQNLLNKVDELRVSPNDIDNASISTLGENATQQLRDLCASLRREKDIWQTRYTDAQQRADELAANLEFVQHQLSTTRSLLETMRSEKNHIAKRPQQELKDANYEAALYKEHNASLRSAADELRGRVVELEALVAAKEELVEPLSCKCPPHSKICMTQLFNIDYSESKGIGTRIGSNKGTHPDFGSQASAMVCPQRSHFIQIRRKYPHMRDFVAGDI